MTRHKKILRVYTLNRDKTQRCFNQAEVEPAQAVGTTLGTEKRSGPTLSDGNGASSQIDDLN